MSLYTAIRTTSSIKSVKTEAFYISAETNTHAILLAKELFFNNQQRIFITNNDALDNAPVVLQSGVSIETITHGQVENWASVMTSKSVSGGEEYAPSYIEISK